MLKRKQDQTPPVRRVPQSPVCEKSRSEASQQIFGIINTIIRFAFQGGKEILLSQARKRLGRSLHNYKRCNPHNPLSFSEVPMWRSITPLRIGHESSRRTRVDGVICEGYLKMDTNSNQSHFLKKVFLVLLVVQFCIVLVLQLPFHHVKGYHRKFVREPIVMSGLKKHSPTMNMIPEKIKEKQQLPEYILQLDKNPIYSKFNISNPPERSKTNLLIIVSSAPRRTDRRSAIRETWWTQCKSNEKVKVTCVFMTDHLDPSKEEGKQLLEEQRVYKDLAFQNLKGGVEFGIRFLYHMLWAIKNYQFDYFMRMDDDYFFCLEKFLHELPLPMLHFYHWGYVHCIQNIVRPEESIIMLSNDLIKKFLDQDPNVIKGHPWADQMIATWVGELNLPQLYNHDPRLHHHPPLRDFGDVSQRFSKVCTRFIGVHGSYPKDMRKLWTLREGNEVYNSKLGDFANKCRVPQVFNWMTFGGIWRYEPKKLINNPTWDTGKQNKNGKDYGGREEGQNR